MSRRHVVVTATAVVVGLMMSLAHFSPAVAATTTRSQASGQAPIEPHAAQAVAAPTRTPQQAVNDGVAAAAAQGVTQYVSVVERASGRVVARSANAGQQVASESVMKMLLAAYYLVIYGGPANTPPDLLGRLRLIVQASDNPTTSALFTPSAIPMIAARYGLSGTGNAIPTPGRWGAARITADDMAVFLLRAGQDPLVGPWLLSTMAGITDFGAGDGFDQRFGLNGISGERGAKQGWGGDSTWFAERWTINSVGYTDRYYVALLSTSMRYADPARATLTATAAAIQSSRIPVADGDFVLVSGRPEVYRIAGGAPVYVSSWSAFGGIQPYRVLTSEEFAGLRPFPADGTFIGAGSVIYRIAGGAPLFVSDWNTVGGIQPTTFIDPAAIANAGGSGAWRHLRQHPADGTFIGAGSVIYRIAGGAPLFVSDWNTVGGIQPTTFIDPAAIANAGGSGAWRHLRQHPADGTFIGAGSVIYRIAGGAPLFVSDWNTVGGIQPTTFIDPAAIANAGGSGAWRHLRQHPADGTFIGAGSVIYRIAGGAPLFVSDWNTVGGIQPTTFIDPAAIANAGGSGAWRHLRQHPADGTFIGAGSVIYRIAGGAPLFVPDWSVYGGVQPTTFIDPAAVAQAGGGGAWNHLRWFPADDTFLTVAGNPSVFRVLDGRARFLPTWAEVGGVQPVTLVDYRTISNAGSGGAWNHLLPTM